MHQFDATIVGDVLTECIGKSSYVWTGLGEGKHKTGFASCRHVQSGHQWQVEFVPLSSLPTPSDWLLTEVASIDQLSSMDYRSSLLFDICRTEFRCLPNVPLALDLPSVPLLLSSALYSSSRSAISCAHSEARVLSVYSQFVLKMNPEVDHIQRMYLAVIDPKLIVQRLHENNLEVFALHVQDRIIHSTLCRESPHHVPQSHSDQFSIMLLNLIESNNMEPHSLLIDHVLRVYRRKSARPFSLLGQCHDPPDPGYQTLSYLDHDSRTQQIVYQTTNSILNNCGLTTWPAGFFLAEYCLMSSIVSGKRCLELGCGGTGVVSTICSRMDPRAYMATDYNDEVLEKLSSNLVDNNVHEVMVRRLDWFDVDDAILAESAPELILLSDTIYSPDLIGPQVSVISRGFALGASLCIMANCIRQPTSFELLKAQLNLAGLAYQIVETDSVFSRFLDVNRSDNLCLMLITSRT